MSTKVATAFLERVQKSGLVSSEKLSQLRQELEIEGVDVDDPTALAKALVARNELSRWQADKLLQGKHKGFFLGSYRLERPLGKGGMGAVFLARHVVMRRQCAIKVLPQTQIQKHSSVLDRFILESQAVAALDHQNIVRAYDVAKEVKDNKEIHYLVMEYVSGQDAQQTVQEHGVLSYVKAAEIIRQTANGLAHAHENGLVHRDIKPANVLMDNKGIVKILDLGLARFFDDEEAASLTAAHNETVLGTADYLSPEQALNSHDVDLRTDIYSLGCTAVFLLTGHPPFPDGTVAQRLVAHQVKQPKPITDDRPDAPADLVAIIDKMMAKKADDRFQNCNDISTALAAWLIKHGGEDWRRQHSEITADSAILKALLTTHREPTRAMTSPMVETHLELVMEDDDEDDESPTSSGSNASLGSGKARGGGSSSLLEGELDMADDQEDRSAPVAEPQESPDLDAEEDAEPMGTVDELPTLNRPSDSHASDEGLFGDLPLEGGLDALDLVDQTGPLDAIGSSPGLGALESDIRKMPVGSPSSSTRQRSVAQQTPKTLWESVTSIGLPIMVGIAGGGILVVVVLLVYLFSGSAETDRSGVRPTAPVRPESVSTADNAAVTPEQETDSSEPRTPGEPTPSNVASEARPSHGPDDSDTVVAQANVAASRKHRKQQPKSEDSQQRPKDQPRPGNEAPSQPTASSQSDTPAVEKPPADGGESSPSGQAAPVASGPQSGSENAKTTPNNDADATETLPPQAPSVPQASPTQLFAALEGFAVQVKMEGGDGGGRNKPKQTDEAYTGPLRAAIEDGLDYAVRNTGLALDENSETAVMNVTISHRIADGFNVLSLAASLDCRSRDAVPVSVWKIEKAEVMRFKAGANNRVLMGTWEDKVREFFRPLRDDHEKAMHNAGR